MSTGNSSHARLMIAALIGLFESAGLQVEVQEISEFVIPRGTTVAQLDNDGKIITKKPVRDITIHAQDIVNVQPCGCGDMLISYRHKFGIHFVHMRDTKQPFFANDVPHPDFEDAPTEQYTYKHTIHLN